MRSLAEINSIVKKQENKVDEFERKLDDIIGLLNKKIKN